MDVQTQQGVFECFVEIVKVLVWPVFLLVALYVTRDQLPSFIKKVKRVKLHGLGEIEFSDVLMNEATTYSGNLLNLPSDDEVAKIIEISKLAKEKNIDIEKIIKNLSFEYDLIRVSLDRSQKRTKLMDEKAMAMRLLGTVAVPIREKLALSSQAGERLAAIMSLQVSPCPFYIEWLYGCINEERAFLQCHSLLALRSFIKNLPKKYRHKIGKVLEKIKINQSKDWSCRSDRSKLFDEVYAMFSAYKNNINI